MPRWRNGCNGSSGNVSIVRWSRAVMDSPDARRFQTVPSGKLGSQLVLRRVGAGTRTCDNSIVIGQGSDSTNSAE